MKSTFEYCIPVYNGEDNWHNIEAYNAEAAARTVAKRYNEEGDYSLMDGSTEYVLIRKDEDSPIQIFSMSAEQSIDYWANEVNEIKCKRCGVDLKEKVIKGEVYSNDRGDFCSHTCFIEWFSAKHEEYKNFTKSLK